ncbi:MAG: sugar phosphate nucleotidyltransferase [Steroidobacteraceae bacterium]|jgi:mannose-1-phosphate guanylyltransferase
MRTDENTWAIVLAGGEGTRLHSLTTTALGVAVPKQFCSLRGGNCLLLDALKRAESVASPAYICTVVSQQHRHWWGPPLSALPTANIIIQPRNCGTANGILLPLLHIVARDPGARIVVLPSDHHVRDEQVLAAALQRAVRELSTRCEQILLMGMIPDAEDPDLGYIVPGSCDGAVATIDRFVEKPPVTLARVLVDAGALWNAFILAARARALVQLFIRRFPQLVIGMQAAVARGPFTARLTAAAMDFYRDLPEVDFSRNILQGAESVLRVLQVPRCGWSDLGTPRRLAATLLTLPQPGDSPDDARNPTAGVLNLSVQHARLQAAAIGR